MGNTRKIYNSAFQSTAAPAEFSSHLLDDQFASIGGAGKRFAGGPGKITKL